LDDKQNIVLYLEEVDRTLFTEILHDKTGPLVIAAVEYLVPIYKSITKYKYIAEQAITGNYEHESLSFLFDQVKEAIAPYFSTSKNNALKMYYDNIATAQTSSMPEKVIPASHYAQIEDLFVRKGAHLWGKFNEADNQLVIHNEKQEGDRCLLNEAVMHTYLNGGTAYELVEDKMPKESIVAAYVRF
jgi:hypothetical protein